MDMRRSADEITFDERWEVDGLVFYCSRIEWDGRTYLLAWQLLEGTRLQAEMFGHEEGFYDRLRRRVAMRDDEEDDDATRGWLTCLG